mmetsp:Transcript_11583/g.26417  ORF Transcript_11583/g.26417 Transcript_11583/m.26417 type:complete len:374 (-) Transcript_11583:77-1198(-)
MVRVQLPDAVTEDAGDQPQEADSQEFYDVDEDPDDDPADAGSTRGGGRKPVNRLAAIQHRRSQYERRLAGDEDSNYTDPTPTPSESTAVSVEPEIIREVEYSPRRPAPVVPPWKPPTLSYQPPRGTGPSPASGPDPWVEGGGGTLSAKRPDRERSMLFDGLWKSDAVQLSADRTIASIRNQRPGNDFGGFVLSQQPLARKPSGRYFEVKIEESDTSRWTDGLGIGVAVIASKDEVLLKKKNTERCIEGFAYELLPESWLIGYDGRAKFCGNTRFFQGSELPRGFWRPSELSAGDVLGLLVLAEGHMMLFVNKELRVFVRCGEISWKKPICAVVDVNGCTKTVHLMDNNGHPDSETMAIVRAVTKPPGPVGDSP